MAFGSENSAAPGPHPRGPERGKGRSKVRQGLEERPPGVHDPGHQAELLQLHPDGPVGHEAAVEGGRCLVGPHGDQERLRGGASQPALIGRGPGKRHGDRGCDGRQGMRTAGPRGRGPARVRVRVRGKAVARLAAEGVGGGAATGDAAAAAAGGSRAPAGLQRLQRPGALETHHGLGGGVEAAELLVKQLDSLPRELGEDVPVHLATQPREAV